MIDLRSDTVTRPTRGMMEFMMNAKVGDDVFEDDPTVKELELRTAELFGMTDGLFCPSGTMSNQIALCVHLSPGDEVICSRESHIYNYEGGGVARNAGASVRLINRSNGIIHADEIIENINPDDVHQPITKLLALENTCNRGGGNCYEWSDMIKIAEVCRSTDIGLHMDGARLFNAIQKKGDDPNLYGQLFDSISLCFSKGLGTPLGSVLIGSNSFIKKARRVRKVLGGGMRQVGIVAAAGIYALDHHVDRLVEDHFHAQMIAKALGECSWIDHLLDVETNIVVGSLKEGFTNSAFIKELENKGVMSIPFGDGKVRMVTHLDVRKEDVDKVISSLDF